MKVSIRTLRSMIHESFIEHQMPDTSQARNNAVDQLNNKYPHLQFDDVRWGDSVLLDLSKVDSEVIDVLQTDPIATSVWKVTDLGDGTFKLETHELVTWQADEERLNPHPY